MRLIVKNIEWNCDDKNKSSLPNNVTINNPGDLITDYLIDKKEVCNFLSYQFGYCVRKFDSCEVENIDFANYNSYENMRDIFEQMLKQNKRLAEFIVSEYDIFCRMNDVRNEIKNNTNFNKYDFSESDIRDIAMRANDKISDYYCDWQQGVWDSINEYIEEEFDFEEED